MPPKKRKAEDDITTISSSTGPTAKKVDSKATPEKKQQQKLPLLPVEFKIKNDYPKHYRTTTNFQQRNRLFEQVVDEENYCRALFAQDRQSFILDDPYLMLVDVHTNEDIFMYTEYGQEERSLPKIFPLIGDKRKQAGSRCIVDEREFMRNLDVFSEFQLKYLNWENVFLAGGSVLACLQSLPPAHAKDNVTKRNYFHNLAYKSSDLDIFIYGIDDPNKANDKVEEIYQAVIQAIPVEALAFRSTHAITIVSQYPYRHIQIVLRLYKSPAEILMGFDVDSCSVGYDGKRVWMTPRAQRALTHQFNTVDMSRRSPSYEIRLSKYASRGFEVVVPTLDRSKIDPQLFERRFDQLQGLAKLLLLEKLDSPEARTKFKAQQRLRKLRPEAAKPTSIIDSSIFHDEWNNERLMSEGGADASDYSTVFLPWGPKWNAKKCRKMMYTKDLILNSKWYDPKKKHHTHPCFMGTVKEVIVDCCRRCPPVPPSEQEFHNDNYVFGPVEWITVNPGQQAGARIGSFHPITEGDWTEGAYISKESERLFQAVNNNDTAQVKELIAQSINVCSKDSTGRTALHIAAFCNSVDVAKLLIENGARISSKTVDGRTALHISAEYGHPEILRLLLKRANELKQQPKDQTMKDASEGDKEKKKKKKKKDKKKKKKKKDDDDDGSSEESGGGSDEEEEEEDEDEDEDEEVEFESIKQKLERKKRDEQKAKEEMDPSLKADEGEDKLEIDDTDWDMKMTALHYAAYFGCSESIKALIEAGADKKALAFMNESGRKIKTYTLLHLSVLGNNLRAAKCLLQQGVKIEEVDLQLETVLHKSAGLLLIDFLTLFLEWKNDSGKNPLDINALSSQMETPLQKAIDAPYFHRDTDTEPKDLSLSDPLTDQKFEVIEYLVSQGVKVELSPENLPSTYRQQQFGGFIPEGSRLAQLRTSVTQPLVAAIQMNSPKLVKYFLKHKANPNWVTTQKSRPRSCLDLVLEWKKEKTKKWKEEKPDNYEKFLPKNVDSFTYFDMKIYLTCVEPNRWGNRSPFSVKYDYTKEGYTDEEVYKETVKKQREMKLKMMEEIEQLLEKNGAKRFSQIKLKKEDTDLKNLLCFQLKDEDSVEKNEPPALNFSSIAEQVPGIYTESRGYDTEDQINYKKLFAAVYRGDIPAIEDLTIKKEIGKQAHIASQSNISNLSLVDYGIIKNNPELLERLLEIALAQYTPLKPPERASTDVVKSINNYDVAKILNQWKPGSFFDIANMAIHHEYDQLDPNKPQLQLNCITSPASILLKNSDQFNSLHLMAYYNLPSVFSTLVNLIKKLDIVPTKYTTQPTSKEQKESVLEKLFKETDLDHLTPLNVAIVHGHTEVAGLFISSGALDPQTGQKSKKLKQDMDGEGEPAKQPEEEEEYRGLDIGGKKMDWAIEKSQSETDEAAMNNLHYAALINQTKSIQFLLSGNGLEHWKESKSDSKIPRDFDIASVDKNGNTAYHFAAFRDHVEAIETLFTFDSAKVFDKPNKSGLTPLHISSHNGFISIVKLLTKRGADIEAKENKTGWTPIFFAIHENKSECVSLLMELKANVEATTKTYKQTPLMAAAYFGKAEPTKLLLNSGHCNRFAKDCCGEVALHHAIKEGHFQVVKLLVDKFYSGYSEESGVGLNPFDCSLLKLLLPMEQHRTSGKENDIEVEAGRKLIYDYLLIVLQRSRVIASTVSVVSVTEMMTESAVEETKLEQLRKHNIDVDSDDETMGANDFSPIFPHNIISQFFIKKVRLLPKPSASPDTSTDILEVEQEEEPPTSLKDLVFTISGISQEERQDLIKIITDNGGKYSSTLTKSVTHVIVSDPGEVKPKIEKAREEGKKVVSPKFLETFKKKNDKEKKKKKEDSSSKKKSKKISTKKKKDEDEDEESSSDKSSGSDVSSESEKKEKSKKTAKKKKEKKKNKDEDEDEE